MFTSMLSFLLQSISASAMPALPLEEPAACPRGETAGLSGGHSDGNRFFNPDGDQGSGGAEHKSALHFVEIALGIAGSHSWPASVPVKQTKPASRVEGSAMRVTWVGHATTLVQTQGLNILIDPVWAERDSPNQAFGPVRVRAPGVALGDLPPIDLVLISHNHFDHLDLLALREVYARDRPIVLAGLGLDTLLNRHGVAARTIDWGDQVSIRAGMNVIGTRAHHWSARGRHDTDCTLWLGFRITLPGGDLYYAGDSGPGDMRWPDEARGPAPVRLAILPIGPYRVNGPPTGNHIDPVQAVAAFQKVGAAYALGVHWGTFELSDEPIDGPPVRLRQELQRAKIVVVDAKLTRSPTEI
jgi:L-ascorbate metabolism protein UlaG (beta-lactamase superfamily)